MLVNGNTDTREYDNAMREYVKAVMVGLEITGCINPTRLSWKLNNISKNIWKELKKMRDNGFGKMNVLTLIGSKWRANSYEILEVVDVNNSYHVDMDGSIKVVKISDGFYLKRNQNIYQIFSPKMDFTEMADKIIAEKKKELFEIESGFTQLRVA